MKWHRVQGVILRYMYFLLHSFDRLSDMFYWPTIDLILWGMTSAYIQTNSSRASMILLIVISGILFWIITWRGQYEITVNMLDDLWNKNLINLFVTPLKLQEWLLGLIIVGIIKASISFAFASGVAYLLYRVNIYTHALSLVPFALLLIMTGWWVGFLVSGIILRFGTKVQTLAWVGVTLLSPFSAIYYPLSVLPLWAQKIAYFVPTSYAFEGMREVLQKGIFDPKKFLMSLGLNCIYLCLSILFISNSFKKVLEKGLVKVQ